MLRYLSIVMLLGLLSVVGVGCCCVQGMPDGVYGPGACSSGGCGPCGSGPLVGLAGCRGACGDVYVDEWISEPPVVDHCGSGYCGCGRCRQPIRNVLRLLWGTPYATQCNTGLCGPSCDGGCGSCDGMGIDDGYASHYAAADGYADVVHDGGSMGAPRAGCNCGGSHSSHQHAVPGQRMPMESMPSSEGDMQMLPPAESVMPKETSPTPAPSITPTSATRRLNPAVSRRR